MQSSVSFFIDDATDSVNLYAANGYPRHALYDLAKRAAEATEGRVMEAAQQGAKTRSKTARIQRRQMKNDRRGLRQKVVISCERAGAVASRDTIEHPGIRQVVENNDPTNPVLHRKHRLDGSV
jgi:hypothetical protein